MTEIDDAENIESFIKCINECGIYPNRARDFSDYFGPSYKKIECSTDSVIEAFPLYIDTFKEILLGNFEEFRFEDVFDSDDEYINAMTDDGRISLISEKEPRLGAYQITNKKYKFFYDFDFDLLADKFANSMPEFNFKEFTDFMNDWEDYAREEDPKLEFDELIKYNPSANCEKAKIFCDFANKLFGIYDNKIQSFGKEWIAIEYSLSPFYFSLGEGIYQIVFASRSEDRKSWEFIEFLCDY